MYKQNPIRVSELSLEEKNQLIKINPNYGKIVCRCENITYQEIVDAINSPLGVKTNIRS